jgi:hypothetical protein
MTRYRVRSRRKADGRYERNVKSAPCWPQLLFEAHAQITKPVGESGCGVVIEKIVRGRKTKLGFADNSKSHRRLGEIKATLASIASLLKPILKLQAATGDDDTRTCDLWPVCGNRALPIDAASLTPCLGARIPVVTERNSTKVDRSMQKIVTEDPYRKCPMQPVAEPLLSVLVIDITRIKEAWTALGFPRTVSLTNTHNFFTISLRLPHEIIAIVSVAWPAIR